MHTKCQSQFVPLHRVRGDASGPLLQRLERCCGLWQRQMDSSGGSGGSAGDTAATLQLQQVDGAARAGSEGLSQTVDCSLWPRAALCSPPSWAGSLSAAHSTA